MKLSSKAENILDQINRKNKLGDLRKIAKDIKKDRIGYGTMVNREIFAPAIGHLDYGQ